MSSIQDLIVFVAYVCCGMIYYDAISNSQYLGVTSGVMYQYLGQYLGVMYQMRRPSWENAKWVCLDDFPAESDLRERLIHEYHEKNKLNGTTLQDDPERDNSDGTKGEDLRKTRSTPPQSSLDPASTSRNQPPPDATVAQPTNIPATAVHATVMPANAMVVLSPAGGAQAPPSNARKSFRLYTDPATEVDFDPTEDTRALPRIVSYEVFTKVVISGRKLATSAGTESSPLRCTNTDKYFAV